MIIHLCIKMVFVDNSLRIYSNFAIDPYPDIHAKHSDDIEIYGAFDKERHEVGDEISVVGRVNPNIDVDASKISVFDDDGNKVHETSIDISDYYNEIATIDTTGCVGVLNYKKSYSKAILEECCRQALEMNHPTYTFVKNTIAAIASEHSKKEFDTAEQRPQ